MLLGSGWFEAQVSSTSSQSQPSVSYSPKAGSMAFSEVHKNAYRYGIIGLTALVLLFEVISFSSTGWMRFEGTSRIGDQELGTAGLERNRRFVTPSLPKSTARAPLGPPLGTYRGENAGNRRPNSSGSFSTSRPFIKRTTPGTNVPQRPMKGEAKSTPKTNSLGNTIGPNKRPWFTGRPTKRPTNNNMISSSRKPFINNPIMRPSKTPSTDNSNHPTKRPFLNDAITRTSKTPSNGNSNRPTKKPFLDDVVRRSSKMPPNENTKRPTKSPYLDDDITRPSRTPPKWSSRAPDDNQGPDMRPTSIPINPSSNRTGNTKFVDYIIKTYNRSWTGDQAAKNIISKAKQRNVTLSEINKVTLKKVLSTFAQQSNETSPQSLVRLRLILLRIFSAPNNMKRNESLSTKPPINNGRPTARPSGGNTNEDGIPRKRGNGTSNQSNTGDRPAKGSSTKPISGGDGDMSAQSGTQGQWVSVDIGLWAAVVCQTYPLGDDQECVRTDGDYNPQGSSSMSMRDVQVEAVFAIMFGALGCASTVLLVLPSCLPNRKRVVLIFGICGLIVSGLLYAVSIARAVRINSANEEQARRDYDQFNTKTPWCLVIGGIGAGLAFLTSGILATSKWVENRKEWKEFSDEVVFSNETYHNATPETESSG